MERWLFDEVDDHVGIYGSNGAEGLSAFNAGLVNIAILFSILHDILFLRRFIKLNEMTFHDTHRNACKVLIPGLIKW